jgi:hypothetical protein
MFELISNACLYNIVFVNNLSYHLKNSGSATNRSHYISFVSWLRQLITCLEPQLNVKFYNLHTLLVYIVK